MQMTRWKTLEDVLNAGVCGFAKPDIAKLGKLGKLDSIKRRGHRPSKPVVGKSPIQRQKILILR